MRAVRSTLTFALISMSGLVFSCAEELPSGYGTLQLALASCPSTSGLALDGYGACGFRLTVYGGTWRDSAPETVYASDCIEYRGDQVAIRKFPTGDSMTLYLEMYSDKECTKPRLVGLRGGVTVPEGDASPGVWYVPTFEVGGFKALPTYTDDARANATKTTCATDADCWKRDAKSGNFLISPAALCNTKSKQCELPASLFPLNSGTPRAFHSAVSIGEGRIALVGGLSREVNDSYLATDDTIEVFDPATMLWARPVVTGFSQQRFAFSGAVGLGGNRVGVFGGARQMSVSLGDGAGGTSTTAYFKLPATPATGTDVVSDLAFVVDLGTATATTTKLSSARFRPHAARVDAGGSRVLVAGGAIASGTGTAPVESVDLCDVSVSPPKCASAPDVLKAGRSGHCGLCLDAAGGSGDCKRLLLFGGTAADKGDSTIGELYEAGKFTAIPWKPGASLGAIGNPMCAASGAQTYLLGGASASTAPADITPKAFTLPVGKLEVVAADLTNTAKVAALARVHGATTVLSDGRVLVTGGVDAGGKPTASAYLVKGGDLTEQKALQVARFGHTATLITTGRLKGAVLVAGGFTLKGGKLALTDGAEIYVP